MRIIAAAAALSSCVAMVCFPSVAVLSAQKAIDMWLGNVVPALLPFFIFADFITGLGVAAMLPVPAYTFTMSFMSGYPMGARLIGDFYRNGTIDKREAKRMLSFCSTTGPAFLMGTVGYSMLGSVSCGVALAIAHYGGSLLNGVFFTMLLGRGKRRGRSAVQGGEQNAALLDIFTDAILAALRSMGIILAYIIIFTFFSDLLELEGPLRGVIEMTVGCSAAANAAAASLETKLVLISGLTAFGGLSVAGQSMSMLKGTDISVPYYIAVKLSQAVFSVLIALFIVRL